MEIKKIFIANLAENAHHLIRYMSFEEKRKEIYEDNALSDRFLFSEEDDRLLISPVPLDKDFFEDSKRILSLNNVYNLVPKDVGESVCDAVLNDNFTLQTIIEAIKSNPGVGIAAYALTEPFARLVKYLLSLGLDFKTPEIPDVNNFWINSFFDSKSGFRQGVGILKNKFPAMSEGAICFDNEEIVGWAKYLFRKYEGVVLKINHGHAGIGVRIIREGDCKDEEPCNIIRDLLIKDPMWRARPIVVEAFIDVDETVCGGNPNVEMRIDGKITPLYVCAMRIAEGGTFKGVEIGKGAVPASLENHLYTYGKTYAEFLKNVGYMGFFDVDFVFGKNKALYPVESNIRRTGGTHVYEIGKRVLGDDFVNKYYIVAINEYPASKMEGKKYKEVRNLLNELLFPMNGKKEGVIITVCSELEKGKIGYVVIGENKERVNQIEEKFLNSI